jgi:hypothetical protein
MRHITLLLGLLALGCSTGFSRGEMEGSFNEGDPVYSSSKLSIEQIEKLQPQVSLPIRLAVAPPNIFYRNWGGRSSASWSHDEIAEIESWLDPLSQAGVVSDLLILPSVLIEQCRWNNPGCMLRESRIAASRVQADAILMVRLATDLDEYVNPISVLNITIVGMWLAPGHHRDALTIAEGVMIDTRNEYLYAFARGEAESSIIRPLVYADPQKAIEHSRLLSLQEFGMNFIQQASQLKNR